MSKVLTYRPASNKIEFLDYTERTVHTKHGKMYKITASTGHSIKVTDDHSLATIGDKNFFKPIPPAESLGSFVPIPFRLDFLENDSDFESTCYDPDKMITWPSADLFAALCDTKEYTTNNDKLFAETQYLLFKAGLYYEINGKRLLVDKDSFGFVPEDGKLIRRELANFTNQYRLLPFTWAEVVSVEEVEREEITYDFTVPEFPLFIANSILVYDTMQVHVPATEAGRVDAIDKMLPSKNLFSVRTLDPMMLPQQEHTFGAFLSSKPSNAKPINVTSVTELRDELERGVIKPNNPVNFQGHKTTAGIVLINEAVPQEFRDYSSVWNGGKIKSLMASIGKKYPGRYTQVADAIKELGSQFAYQLGASFKSSDFDLADLKKKRDAEFSKIEAELKRIDKSSLSKEKKYEKKVETLRRAQAISADLTAAQNDNHFQQWAYSGSRGSKSQVMQIISSPVVVADPRDRVIPMLIKKSFNEGLSPADYWISSYGTRKGTVASKVTVPLGGGLSKEIIGNVLDVVITKKDCGTKDGVTYPLGDTKDVLERYEAGTNRLIDARYYEELHKRGVKEIKVRSPIKCQARNGVCQMCYGHSEKGALPEIGDNIGIQAAQAITEPLTQMGLSSKHTAGTAAEEKVGLNTIAKFFTMPNQYSGAALIAENTGRVTRMEPAPAGGTNLWIDNKRYHAVPGRKLRIKLGDEVKAGDILTSGVPNLAKIVPHKGIDYSRELFVREGHDLYNRAGAPSIKKNFETIARGLINYVEIEDPGDFDFIVGDVLDYNELKAEIKENPTKRPPKFKHVQRGTSFAAQDKNDWLANFGFKYLSRTLRENAAMGVKSNVHSYHPVAGYATAYQFGEGKDGRY